jgi:hypothetical protein
MYQTTSPFAQIISINGAVVLIVDNRIIFVERFTASVPVAGSIANHRFHKEPGTVPTNGAEECCRAFRQASPLTRVRVSGSLSVSVSMSMSVSVKAASHYLIGSVYASHKLYELIPTNGTVRTSVS